MSYKSGCKDWLSSRWSSEEQFNPSWSYIHIQTKWVPVLVQRGWCSWSMLYILAFIQNSIDVRTTKMSCKWLTCFIFCNCWFHLINPGGRTSWRGAATVVVTTIVNYKIIQISKKRERGSFSNLTTLLWKWWRGNASVRLISLVDCASCGHPGGEQNWGEEPEIFCHRYFSNTARVNFFLNRTQLGLLVSPPKVRAFLI